jgi:hypothetical protein
VSFLNFIVSKVKKLVTAMFGNQPVVKAQPEPQACFQPNPVEETPVVVQEVVADLPVVETSPEPVAVEVSETQPKVYRWGNKTIDIEEVKAGLRALQPSPPAIVHPPYHEIKSKRRQSYRTRTLGTLLSNIEDVFKSNTLPYDKLSWIDRDHVTALKRLGTYVPYREEFDLSETFAEVFKAEGKLPSLFALSYGFSKHDSDEEDLCHPSHFVGYRLKTTPAYIDYCPGQLFGFGMSIRLAGKDGKGKKSLAWFGGFITVKPDGTLYIHSQRRPHYHAVSQRGKRSDGYTTMSWGDQPFVQFFGDDKHTAEERVELVRTFFAHALHDWIMRKESWSVNVHKDNSKITFSVPKEETASYFKDRLKVTTESGATKRILHYVNEHDRTRNGHTTTVKAHIRGLDRFDWKGYDCRITAPSFNGVLTSEFNIVGDEKDARVHRGEISAVRLVGILNQLEEHGRV